LTTKEVQQYVTRQLGAQTPVGDLAEQVYHRTDGNPLFMVNVVEQYQQQGSLDETAPASVQEMIGRQIARLREEQRQVLEAGSVMGNEFAVAAVATALKGEEEVLEERCEELEHTARFLQEAGITEWPDGTLSGQYRFRHALYQNVLYQRLSEARRVRLHRLIGERLEAGYGDRSQELAAELAMHFERGRDTERTLHYRYAAGQNAKRRSAHAEAFTHFNAGLALLASLPDSLERRRHELRFQMAIAPILQMTKGSATAESAIAYTRALELAQRDNDKRQAFIALTGLWLHSWMSGGLQRARQQSEQLLAMAQQEHSTDEAFVFAAQFIHGSTLFYLGEPSLACAHLEQAANVTSVSRERFSESFSIIFIEAVPAYLAFGSWILGYPEQARVSMQKAVAIAHDSAFPYPIASTLAWSTILQQYLQERQRVALQSEQVIQLSLANGFPQWTAVGEILQGWARSGREQSQKGQASMQRALAAFRASGARVVLSYFLSLIADAYLRYGDCVDGLAVIAEAFAVIEETDERFYEAELYRLKGELLLQQARQQATTPPSPPPVAPKRRRQPKSAS
jgi:predicted ATPase